MEIGLSAEHPQVGGEEFNLVVTQPDVDWELSTVVVEQSSPG